MFLSRLLPTYFKRGIRVKLQIIALIAPITSSWEGMGPEGGNNPFKVNKGDVARSLYMIPTNPTRSHAYKRSEKAHKNIIGSCLAHT